ncbi:MAG: response regulator transcription factor [Bdellovibrionales bacterium]|nr:response regulator transcription factor [Bdellovibrionales bacterium]
MTKKIIILEDDVAFAETLAEGLRQEGIQSIHITEPRELSSVLKNNKIDLILSDIMLEDSMGFDIIKLLNFTKVNTPVIFMTGFDNTPELSKALSHRQVIDVLVKPFKISILVNLINNL